jgi:ABC-type branched-subunit amino acid transport system substrate-binding protein
VDDCLSEEELAELADGSLDESRLEAAEKHLAECLKCSGVLEASGEILDGFAGFMNRALRELDAEAPLPAGEDEPAILARGTVVGRYEIIEAIGAGGMGRVYAARDPTLGRKVALKLLHRSSATADLEARLLREAKAMARLSYPEVIGIHDVGHYGDQLFIAMELVDGGTLRDWLTAAPRTWKEVLSVFLRAGRGLAQAHAAGIIHRDFKPDNVLVGKDGRVRVTDFGLARTQRGEDGPESSQTPSELGGASTLQAASPAALSTAEIPLTRTGALLGTPAYMAPEQHAGAPADLRSDIYSFCVSLFEGLVGRRPFLDTTMAGLHARKLAGPPMVRNARRGVPERVMRVVVGGLAPKPADRYESMDALLSALERAQRTRPRWPLALGSGVALIALAGIAFGARRAHRETPVAAGARPVECTTNRACVEKHGGAPYVCRPDHTCAGIASEDCVPKFEPEDLLAEDTVWIGAMFPTKGEASDFGAVETHTVDLARREIAQTTRAFTGDRAPQHLRRIAFAVCDDSTDAVRAGHHLVDDVGVPAVLGFRSGQEVIDLAGSLLIRAGVVSIATLSSNPLVTRLPQAEAGPRLVWRTTTSFDAASEAIARMIEDVLEPRAKGGATRVTLVRDNTPGAVSIADRFYRQLHFNGRSALENGDSYREVTFSDTSPEELERAASRIVASRPTFLVVQGDESTTSRLLTKVETSTASGIPKPTYIWAMGSGEGLDAFVGRDADRRRRTFAVTTTSNEPTNARFVIRYNQDHRDQVTRDDNAGETYDAVYLIAYATFAGGAGPVTGASIASAFARLVPPGRPIEVGPSYLFEGVTTLASGRSIDLAGTGTDLDFDLATGECPADFGLFCMRVNGAGEASGLSLPSGVTYGARAQRVGGTLRCP